MDALVVRQDDFIELIGTNGTKITMTLDEANRVTGYIQRAIKQPTGKFIIERGVGDCVKISLRANPPYGENGEEHLCTLNKDWIPQLIKDLQGYQDVTHKIMLNGEGRR